MAALTATVVIIAQSETRDGTTPIAESATPVRKPATAQHCGRIKMSKIATCEEWTPYEPRVSLARARELGLLTAYTGPDGHFLCGVFPDATLNTYLGTGHFRVVAQKSICTVRSADTRKHVSAYVWQRQFANDLIESHLPRPQQVNTTVGQRALLYPPTEVNQEYTYVVEIPAPDAVIRFSIGSDDRANAVGADAKALGDKMLQAIAEARR